MNTFPPELLRLLPADNTSSPGVLTLPQPLPTVTYTLPVPLMESPDPIYTAPDLPTEPLVAPDLNVMSPVSLLVAPPEVMDIAPEPEGEPEG